jgi:hypothetical protein
MVRNVVAVVAVLVLTACGEAPTSPTPTPPTAGPVNIAGTWTGSMRSSIGTQSVRYELTQSDRSIGGTWRFDRQDGSGTVSGTLSGTGNQTRFGGEITIDAISAAPPVRCTGFAHVEGAAGSAPMTWTSVAFSFANCSDPPTDVTITLNRQ